MVVKAMECFERDPDGNWICTKAITINGPLGAVTVPKGRSFPSHVTYAGYDDFSALLNSVAVETEHAVPLQPLLETRPVAAPVPALALAHSNRSWSAHDMAGQTYKYSVVAVGALIGTLLALGVELTGHPWWFLLMTAICVGAPGIVTLAWDGDGHLLGRASVLSRWSKLALVLLLIAGTLALLQIFQVNPRDYWYVPLMLPVMAIATLFGFGYGLLAVVLCTAAADYLFALPVHDFIITEWEDAVGLAVFAVLGAVIAWIVQEVIGIRTTKS